MTLKKILKININKLDYNVQKTTFTIQRGILLIIINTFTEAQCPQTTAK
jgi:hypothetical protein